MVVVCLSAHLPIIRLLFHSIREEWSHYHCRRSIMYNLNSGPNMALAFLWPDCHKACSDSVRETIRISSLQIQASILLFVCDLLKMFQITLCLQHRQGSVYRFITVSNGFICSVSGPTQNLSNRVWWTQSLFSLSLSHKHIMKYNVCLSLASACGQSATIAFFVVVTSIFLVVFFCLRLSI